MKLLNVVVSVFIALWFVGMISVIDVVLMFGVSSGFVVFLELELISFVRVFLLIWVASAFRTIYVTRTILVVVVI